MDPLSTPVLPATLPRVMGHRGASGGAPENTLVAFRRAKAQGARWVECDVRLTADRVPVLLHDATLDRTTTGHGPVARCSSAEFAQLDAGSWFGPTFRGELAPTLAAACRCWTDLSLGVNLELKADAGDGEALATAVAQVLAAEQAAFPVLISSFEEEALEAAQRHLPYMPRGLLVGSVPPDAAARAGRLGCAALHVAQDRLDRAQVDALRAQGLAVLAYTVNDSQRARTLFTWGVRTVFTDHPERLLEPA
jgi:glycerophosphoryl diester phosphodiesterase